MAVRGQVSDVVAGQDGVEELEARVAAPEARISVPLSSAQSHGTGRGQLDSVWEVVVQVLYQLPVVVNLSTPTGHTLGGKLQAPVYENLPSTNTVFSYAIGSKKLSDNEQFFVGAQTVVSLLQTTQLKQGVSFIAANKVYTRQIKPLSFESGQNSFSFFSSSFFDTGWMRLMFTWVLWR